MKNSILDTVSQLAKQNKQLNEYVMVLTDQIELNSSAVTCSDDKIIKANQKLDQLISLLLDQMNLNTEIIRSAPKTHLKEVLTKSLDWKTKQFEKTIFTLSQQKKLNSCKNDFVEDMMEANLKLNLLINLIWEQLGLNSEVVQHYQELFRTDSMSRIQGLSKVLVVLKNSSRMCNQKIQEVELEIALLQSENDLMNRTYDECKSDLKNICVQAIKEGDEDDDMYKIIPKCLFDQDESIKTGLINKNGFFVQRGVPLEQDSAEQVIAKSL